MFGCYVIQVSMSTIHGQQQRQSQSMAAAAAAGAQAGVQSQVCTYVHTCILPIYLFICVSIYIPKLYSSMVCGILTLTKSRPCTSVEGNHPLCPFYCCQVYSLKFLPGGGCSFGVLHLAFRIASNLHLSWSKWRLEFKITPCSNFAWFWLTGVAKNFYF